MKNLFITTSLLIICSTLLAKEFKGSESQKIIPGTILLNTNDKTGFPNYFQFQNNMEIPISKFKVWINSFLKNPENTEFLLLNKYSDKLGFIHYKYQQVYNNYPVENAVFVLHVKENKIMSFSGNLYPNIEVQNTIFIGPTEAIDVAKNNMNAKSYMWEFQSEENDLKKITNNINASYLPKPELKILSISKNLFKQVYVLTLYSKYPIDKKEYIIDTQNSKILDIRQKLYSADVPGTAITRYSGTQTIITDNSISGSYRLQETGRGNGIRTYNANMGTSYTSATDFTDTDNNWNNVNASQDEVATDAHWASEKTYDYYYNNFGFNSIDNNGFALLSYVHYDLVAAGYANNVNAFWDGQRMTYGDGNATYSPLTTVDIAGHEITHGLTEFNAGLIYQNESGALSEGFSDIFGTAIEFYAKPATANWTVGEDIGSPFRSLQNPNTYGDPDTYHGTNWDNNNEVHQNSTVLSHWFYLVSLGGSGTNDIGSVYNVNGVGIDPASQVAFRMLTVYLTANATYEDARFFSIVSAIDLFGPCTPQVEAVTNAMYAVGIGASYIPTVIADFSSPLTSSCQAPFSVSFQNLSNNSSTFNWDFGDGNTSTLISPSHVYNLPGNYNVRLIADGGSCGKDTTIKNSFVSINSANPCVVVMPLSGTGITQTSCSGKVYDGGGPDGNYIDNADAFITIAPAGATTVTLNFLTFDIEPGDNGTCNYDYIEIFDGANTTATSLGRYCNLNGSPGTVVSSGGALTILLHSDPGLNLAGFEADWNCSLANTAPVANFVSVPAAHCTGDISFTDNSTNGPTSWYWDFGDGTTSTVQNPIHNYTSNGTFDVSLTATNTFGSNTYTSVGIVNINIPTIPVVDGDSICSNEQAMLQATGNGTINWFNVPIAGTVFYSGNSYTTPFLTTTTTYYVENSIPSVSEYVGPTNNTYGGGTNTSQSYLIFDCFSPVELVSVSVNAINPGNKLIELKNSAGTVLQSATINIPSDVSRITLNFNVPIGTDLRLVAPANCGLYRINTASGASISYPYSITGVLSIKNSSAGIGSYYYFFDWEIKEPDCISTREPVIAFVDDCQNIKENFSDRCNIYPNPVNDKLFLDFKLPENVNSIFITDVLGKQFDLKFEMINNVLGEVNFNNIPSGIYFISIQTSNGLLKHKIIKN